MDQRCIECVERSNRRLIEKFRLASDAAGQFDAWYTRQRAETGEPTVELQRRITQKISHLTGVTDLFHEEKKNSNQLAKKIYDEWQPKTAASSDPLLLALKLAIAGNIMDYGAHDHFDLEATIQHVLKTPFAIDHTEQLRERLTRSARLLYLADNAGEIVLDRLLLETIGHPEVVLVVRGGPVLNDATLADALEAGIDRHATIISSGVALPSTDVEKSSDELKRHFNEADLIISKGQGNLEGLIDRHDPRIFFLLMAKCGVMAEKLGVLKGSYIVMNKPPKP